MKKLFAFIAALFCIVRLQAAIGYLPIYNTVNATGPVIPSPYCTNGELSAIFGDNNYLDYSGSGNNGTQFNGVTFVTGQNGLANNAMSFTAASSQYVSVGTSLGVSRNTSITLSCWVKINSGAASHGAFMKWGNNTDPSGGDGIAIGIGGTGGSVGFENSGTELLILFEGIRWVDTGSSITDSNWHNLVVVIDPSGFPYIYWDGTFIFHDTGALAVAIGSKGTSVTQVGGYLGAGSINRYCTAYIDDARFIGAALSSSAVSAIYSNNAQ